SEKIRVGDRKESVFCAECEEDSVTSSATFLFALQETSPVLCRTSYLGKGTTDKKMPEGAGVTVPNEPDGNSDLDEQMEMSPSLAANPTPIQPMSTDQRCHPAPGQAAKPSVHGHGVRRSNPDAGIGNTLSSEETTLRTLKEIINKWVSDITCFGICSLDNCNAKEIENKLIFEEAERKRNISSSSSTNNVCSNSSVTSHDNVNVMSNNNNARKRAAPNESECSNNSRIRLDKDGFIYPSRRNSVPKRNLNADENSNILLQNKYADIERLPVEKEGPPAPPKIQPLMIRNNNNYKEMLKNLNNKFGKVNAALANEYIKVYPETAEEHRDMQKFCREEKIEFYVIRPLSERPFKIVMKGLHRDTDIEEIKSELAIALPEIEILKVGQLKNVRTKSPMDIFMIELKKNGHENKIFELTHFMFLKIKIQNYRKPPGATQCRNCNMFNHSSANCGFQTRCLKCGEDHRTNQCPITTPQENPKCINCGATGHIASWRGCPLFPKIKPTKGQGVNYPKAQREFLASQYRRQENISYSMQTQKLIPRQVELNSRQESEFNPQTGSREIGHEKEFLGFLEGVKVILTIVFWNANGVRNRSADIRNFLEEHSPDIFLIQETKLRPEINFSIPNYDVYRTDRPQRNNAPTQGGGTGILIKKSLPHHHIPTPQLHFVEATSISLNLTNKEPFTVTSIYIPPDTDPTLYTLDLETLIQLGPNPIICGDFNAQHQNWGSPINTTRGKELVRFTQVLGMEILAPPSPTRFGFNSATILDLAVIKDFILPFSIISLPELYSDHNPVKLTFQLKFTTLHNSVTTHTDWTKFQNYLKNQIDYRPLKINSNTDIEIAVEKFTKNLQNAHRFATKMVKKSTATYIHANIKDLIKTRNKTKKAWQTLRNPLIKTELNRIEKLIKKLDKNSRQKDQTEELEALNTEDGTLWRKAKIMRKKAQKIPALLGENGFAYSDSIKAETIALSLEKQFSLNDLSHKETENKVKKSTENFSTLPLTNNQIDNLKCIQPSEVIKVIRNLNIKKACGLDCITNKMLKNLPCTMIFEFTEIINNIFKFNYFPKAWKTAVVVPILKPGKDPTQPENYRPISLLSTLSKLTENFILDKLNEHLAENKILCPEQFGFRKSLTTTHQLLRVVEYITSGFEKGECTGAVFLDVQKAFDRVWIQGLIHKLIGYKTPPHLLQLLKSYLEERKFAVKIGNSISEAKIMRAGIPQGGKISPVLYSLYVNDIPKTHKTLLGMYADDTAILAKNKNHKYTAAALNQHLAKLDDWFLKWKIALNVNKTEAVYFAKGRRKYKPIVKIKNQTITWSQQAKYLGVILDEKLTWKNHITTIKTKFRAASRKLFPLIARDSEMNRKYKLLVYTAILRPIITYGFPIWGAAANSNIRMLE
ncbi:putative RNA-directed DNA polymerase from transposon BS, partial [Araneus ventricosus]